MTRTSIEKPQVVLHADVVSALRVETEFLSGVEANLEHAKGRQLRGDHWMTIRDDEGDALRALMASRRMYDRDLLKHLPHNRRIVLRGSERRWFVLRRETGVAVASVLAPMAHLLTPDSPAAPPVTLAELTHHVRRIVGTSRVPHVVGVCSPSGFSSDALEARVDLPNVTLVLVSPREGGGWCVSSANESLPDEVRNLFDPEAVSHKLARIRNEIQARSVGLMTGGLSAHAVAESLGLSAKLVELAFRQVADADPELRVTRRSGTALLYRGAPAPMQETSMNVIDRIKQILSRQGDEAQKMNVLSERRAALAQRRDRMYEDISKMEQREAEMLREGRTAESTIVRRRLAAQLAQLRKDIARRNTTANMLNQQIDIISTDIHNLTLIQQGQMARLPDAEELTQNAVRAEEMLETLRANADLVSGLETGVADVANSEETLAILKEFEEAATVAEPDTLVSAEEQEAMRDLEAPAPEPDKRRAEPEA